MTPGALAEWRRGHGLSQRDAAHMLGIALRPYQYHEKGETRGGFRPPWVPRWLELATKGLDMELRVNKLRLTEAKPEPVDAKQIARIYRTLAGDDDAGGTEGVAPVARAHPARRRRASRNGEANVSLS